MQLHLLEPSTVPGCAAGTVATGDTAAAAHTTTVHTRGRAARDASPHDVAAGAARLRDSVVLKMQRDVPERPSLAKSITSSRHVVSSELDSAGVQKLAFDGLDHDKLVQVFERLKGEIDSWQELATVQEEEAESVGAELGRTFLTDVAVDGQVRDAYFLSLLKPVAAVQRGVTERRRKTVVSCERS